MSNKGECDTNYSASRQQKTKQPFKMWGKKIHYTTACKNAYKKLSGDTCYKSVCGHQNALKGCIECQNYRLL